jgi:Protein of unknown function (DUF3592)
LFALTGLVVVGGFAFMTVRIWTNDNTLAERGQQASAQVVAVDQGRADRSRVEFTTADGRRVQALIGQGDEGPDLKVGDGVQVVYDPQEPTADVRDVRVEANHKLAYLMLGATILGAVGVPLALWRMRRAKART